MARIQNPTGHSSKAIELLRSIVEGQGGRTAVVSRGAEGKLYAGARRRPCNTLLEAVLTVAGGNDNYQNILIGSGIGAHLPRLQVADLMTSDHSATWMLRGTAKSDTTERTDINSRNSQDEIDFLDDLSNEFETISKGTIIDSFAHQKDWVKQVEKVLDSIEKMAGFQWLNGNHSKLTVPTERSLVVLDSVLLIPAHDQFEGVRRIEAVKKNQLTARLNALPSLIASSPADLILLAEPSVVSDSLRRGRMIHDQVRELWRKQEPYSFDRESEKDDRLPFMAWPNAVYVLVGNSASFADAKRFWRGLSEDKSLYDLLRQNSPSRPKSVMNEIKERFVGMEHVEEHLIGIREREEENARARRAGREPEDAFPHMALIGNPGTGKTEIAKVIGRIYAELGVVRAPNPEDNPPEPIIAQNLVGQYRGESKERILRIADHAAATNGILIIDEAYGLCDEGASDNDFYKAVQQALLGIMTERKHEIAVFFLGYPKEMDDLFSKGNPGLFSRISEDNFLRIPDYSNAVLFQIVENEANRTGMKLESGTKEAFCRKMDAYRQRCRETGLRFGNARSAKNFLNAANKVRRKRTRLLIAEEEQSTLTAEDFASANFDIARPPGEGNS